ncbi:MAG: flavodoxin family protein [Gammaproteobacteria bacterium]|jgi:putative NADPH-quinone reductase
MSKFKIVIANSSPNMEKGNTHVIAKSFMDGARLAGAEVENIFLAKYKIKSCLACMSCWFETPGKCILQDDAHMILDKMSQANLLIFATPLYVDNVSGIMKNLMDRMIAKGRPEVELDENNETRHIVNDSQLKKIGIISNCGFPEQDQFQVLRVLFRRIARNMNCELAVEIYRGEGPLLSVENSQLKPIIDNYKALVEKAGEEIVVNGKISKDIMGQLEKPLIPYDIYNEAMNEQIDQRLKHTRK